MIHLYSPAAIKAGQDLPGVSSKRGSKQSLYLMAYTSLARTYSPVIWDWKHDFKSAVPCLEKQKLL